MLRHSPTPEVNTAPNAEPGLVPTVPNSGFDSDVIRFSASA